MPIKSRNLSTAAEFARKLWTTNIYFGATGSTLASASVASIILPFAAKILTVKARTNIAGSASSVDVLDDGTSVLSAPITLATTVSTNALGTVSEDEVASGSVLDVILTKASTETLCVSVIVQFRPYLGVAERVAASLADEA